MRFYGGGDPLRWLRQPQCLLWACANMIPKLEAEESLEVMTQVAVGTGSIKSEQSSRIIRALNRQASPQSAQPKKPRVNLSALAAAGIKVEKVAPK